MKKKHKKFNCQDIEKRVQKFLDNVLSEDEYAAFEEHLDYCLPCDKKLAFEKKLKQFIKAKAAEKAYPQQLANQLKNIVSDKTD